MNYTLTVLVYSQENNISTDKKCNEQKKISRKYNRCNFWLALSHLPSLKGGVHPQGKQSEVDRAAVWIKL